MTELCRNKTTLVIAHKLPTVRNADKIAVIGEGTVLECGSHAELLAQGGIYRRMIEASEKAGGWNTPFQELLMQPLPQEGSAQGESR